MSARSFATSHKSSGKLARGKKKQHLSQKVNGDISLLQFISKHPLFSKLNKKDKAEVACMFEVRRYEATDPVIRKGDHANCILIVASGGLNVYSNKPFKESLAEATTIGSLNEESSYHGSMERDSFFSSKNLKVVETNELFGITSFIHKAHYWPSNVIASDATDFVTVLLLTRQNYFEAIKKGKSCFHNIECVVVEATKQFQVHCLRKVPYFKGFPEDFIQNLSKANYFQFEAIDEHQTFIATGDKIKHFYVLLSGEIVIAEEDEVSGFITEYGRIKPVEFFGCTATSLKSDSPEADYITSWAIYKTIKKTAILKIRVEDLKKLCLRAPALNNKLNFERMRSDKAEECVNTQNLFRNIGDSWKKYIQNKLHFVTLQPGSIVKKEGERFNQRFYFIIGGTIDVSIGEEHIATLTAGKYFGENALLRRQPGTATLKVSTKHGLCKCLVLKGSDFRNLVENQPSVEAELRFKIEGQNCPFEYLVAHPYLKAEFLTFAKKEKVEHSIEFLSRIAELEQFNRRKTKKVVVRAFGKEVQVIKSLKVNKLREEALAIFQDFFETPMLNLSSNIDTQIRESFRSGDYGHLSVFQSAKAAIIDNLDFDKYGRFKKTEIFTKYLETMGVYKHRNNY